MRKVRQEKKRELASTFVQLLRKLDLHTTANTLVEEASLARDKNIEQDIKDILLEQNTSQFQRKLAVEMYCRYSLENYLRDGRIDEALQIYQVIVPVYCPNKIQEFSLLFAENYDNDRRGLKMLLESFLQKPSILPQTRSSSLNINNQIWFMKTLGKGILLIDCYSNVFIVINNEIKYRKDKIHNQKTFTVTVKEGEEIFGTGSCDKTVKIWDKTINLLYTIQMHRARINTIALFDKSIICFDQDAVISVHQIPLIQGIPLQRKAVFKTSNPFLEVKYGKMKKRIYGASKNGQLGQINIVNIAKKRIQKLFQIDKKIYSIELSLDEKMIFVNVAPSQIRAYSLTSTHELIHKFTGFLQEKNLMRMSQGGKDGKYLAITSQEGTVRIYIIKEQQEVLKLFGQSKRCINCVLWKQSELIFACDAGNLERWVSARQEESKKCSNNPKRKLSIETSEHEVNKTKKMHIS